MSKPRVGVVGATGRMGRAVVARLIDSPDLQLVAALTTGDDPALGADVGTFAGRAPLGLRLADTLEADLDLLLEFTLPAGFSAWLACAVERRIALVSGTTGLDANQHRALADAGTTIPVLWAPNFSVGVNLLLELVERTAEVLGRAYDVELTETHHRHKVDAPSGTALALVNAVRAGRAEQAAPVVHGRTGHTGERGTGEIGVHALRGGEILGEHDLQFFGATESLTLSHRLHDRAALADGALLAAHWLARQPAGLYTMRDVLRRAH